MLAPTTAELLTAIEVLKKLSNLLNEHAAHSITQLPDTQLADNYAAHLEARAHEQTGHIEIVTMQLQHWRDELIQGRRQNVSESI